MHKRNVESVNVNKTRLLAGWRWPRWVPLIQQFYNPPCEYVGVLRPHISNLAAATIFEYLSLNVPLMAVRCNEQSPYSGGTRHDLPTNSNSSSHDRLVATLIKIQRAGKTPARSTQGLFKTVSATRSMRTSQMRYPLCNFPESSKIRFDNILFTRPSHWR